jgi:hypothetical protein
MKRVLPTLLLLPILTSCVTQQGYYEPGYYPPPPPPPHVEIHRHHRDYQPVPQARVYQNRINNHGNAHGHGNNQPGGHAVVVTPRQPQVRPQQPAAVQPRGPVPSHGPVVVRPTTPAQAVVMQPAAPGPKVIVNQNKVEEHN